MNNLVKHQTITFDNPNTRSTLTGFINKLTEKNAEVVFVENERLRTFKTNANWSPDRLLKTLKARPHEGAPIHPTLKDKINSILNPATAKKGDVVSFEFEGKTHTGRVLKGGAKATVSLNLSELIKITSGALKPAELRHPHPELKEWTVTDWKDRGLGTDGYRSEATIARNGKPVLIVTDNGDGAMPTIEPYSRKSSKGNDDEKDLTEALLKVCQQAKMDETTTRLGADPSLWADYAWRIQPTGITFIEYIQKF